LSGHHGSVQIQDSGTTWLTLENSGSVTNISFANTAVTPYLTQFSQTTDTATQNFTVAAQNAYGSAVSHTTGADLVLQAGNSANATGGGYLTLYGGTNSGAGGAFLGNSASYVSVQNSAVITGVLTLNSWNGSVDTQEGGLNVYPFYANTAASGSNIQLGSGIALQSNKGALFKVNWIRRNNTGSGCLGNEALMIAICNSGGSVTTNTLTAGITPSGAFDDPANIAVSTGANTVYFSVVAQSAAADWQVVITVNYI
jgi:hypothetical protein